MVKRLRRQVARAVLVVLLLSWTRVPAPGQDSPAGLDALITAAPFDTQLFMAVDLRSTISLSQVLDTLDGFKAAHPELADRLEERQAMLGLNLREVARWASPAAFVACYPSDGQASIFSGPMPRPCEFVAGLPVSDPVSALDLMHKLTDQLPAMGQSRPIAQGTETAWLQGHGDTAFAWCVTHNFILVGSSAAALEASLACQRGQTPGLSERPFFRDLRQKLAQSDGLLVYADVYDVLSSLPPIPTSRYVDADTVKPLQAVKYVGISLAPVEDRLATEIFLKLDRSSDSPLIRALLAPRPADTALARYFPTRWGNYNSTEVAWLATVILEAVRLIPPLRRQASFSGLFRRTLGLDPQDLQPAFTDAMAGSSNLLDLLPQFIKPPPVHHTRAGQRLESCQTNLLQLAGAVYRYQRDHHGACPQHLADLVPVYLSHLPRCPAAAADTYSPAWHPQGHSWKLCCNGHHHEDAGLASNLPSFSLQSGLRPPMRQVLQVPRPTSVLAFRVRDADAAQRAIDKVAAFLHDRPRPLKRVGTVDLLALDAHIRYALVRGAVPALLLATGPEADRWLEDAVQAADRETTVASLPDFVQLTGDRDGTLVSVDYLDLKNLNRLWVQLMEMSLARMPRQGQAVGNLAVQTARNLTPPEGVSTFRVESDGLRYVSRGVPTTLLTWALGAAMVVYATSHH